MDHLIELFETNYFEDIAYSLFEFTNQMTHNKTAEAFNHS